MKKVVIVLCVILLPLIYIDLVIRQPWIEERPDKTDIVNEQPIEYSDVSSNEQDGLTESTIANTQEGNSNLSNSTEVSEATQQRIKNFLSNYTEILNNEDVGRIKEFESMFYNYEILSGMSDEISVIVEQRIHMISIQEFELIHYELISIDTVDGDFYDVTLEFQGKSHDEDGGGLTMTSQALINISDKVSFVEDFIIKNKIDLLEDGGQLNPLFSYTDMTLTIEDQFDAVNGLRSKSIIRLSIDITNPTEMSYSFSDEDSRLVIELSNGKIIEKRLNGSSLHADEGNLLAQIDIEDYNQSELSYPIKYIYMKNVITQEDVVTSQMFYGSDYDSFNSKQNELLEALK